MALATATALSSFDQGGNREDLSDVLATIMAQDNETTLNLVGIKGAAKATTHTWVEDELSSYQSAAAEELASAETDLDVYAGDGVKFRIGTLFKFANEPEVMQVTAITTDTLTIVRGYGSTVDPGVAIPTLSVIEIISHPVQEDTDPINWESIIRATAFNKTQVFYKTLKVSDTQEAVDKAGVSSEVSYQTEKKMIELMREMNRTLICGIRSADAGSDTSYRSMGGIIEYVSAAGGNYLDAATTDLTETMLLNLLQQVYEDGGNPDTVVAPAFQKRQISGFWKEYVRVGGGETKIGTKVSTYECDFGTVSVILERHMPKDAILVIDKARVAVMPLDGLSMGIQDLARTGRAQRKQLDGEYTCEIRNALKAHGYYYNLTTS